MSFAEQNDPKLRRFAEATGSPMSNCVTERPCEQTSSSSSSTSFCRCYVRNVNQIMLSEWRPQIYCPSAVACNDDDDSCRVSGMCSRACSVRRASILFNSFGLNADIVQEHLQNLRKVQRDRGFVHVLNILVWETLEWRENTQTLPHCCECRANVQFHNDVTMPCDFRKHRIIYCVV